MDALLQKDASVASTEVSTTHWAKNMRSEIHLGYLPTECISYTKCWMTVSSKHA